MVGSYNFASNFLQSMYYLYNLKPFFKVGMNFQLEITNWSCIFISSSSTDSTKFFLKYRLMRIQRVEMRTSVDKTEFSNLGLERTSLLAQWLELCSPSGWNSALPMQGGPGLIPGQGIRSHRPQLRIHMYQLRMCKPQPEWRSWVLQLKPSATKK